MLRESGSFLLFRLLITMFQCSPKCRLIKRNSHKTDFCANSHSGYGEQEIRQTSLHLSIHGSFRPRTGIPSKTAGQPSSAHRRQFLFFLSFPPTILSYFRVPYTASSTASSHSLEPSTPGTSIARCENHESGAAPCQCFTPTGILTTSPG